MTRATLKMAAEWIGGTLTGVDRPYESVSTDSRTVEPGQLFFALKGSRADGAAFVADAARRGAAGAVVQSPQDADLPQIVVADPQLALGRLAKAWRACFTVPVIGITGSNGKTTVKEMTAAIVRASVGDSWDRVLVTWGNLNNEIGMPVTLLYMNDAHAAAVLELGAAGPGHIAYLADIARPTVAVVTNANRAHLQGFGSVDQVAATKGEIFTALEPTGTAVVNRDDRFFAMWWQLSAGRQRVSFGSHPDADFRATDIRQHAGPDGPGLGFTLQTSAGSFPVLLPMAGQHNVMNALAATAAGLSAGATREGVVAGLGAMRNVAGRLRRVRARGGITVYDDSYNANPGSVRAALEFLASQPGERWFVFGDMAELGPQSVEFHREIGALVRRLGIPRFFCTGPQSREAATAFGAGAQWREAMPELIDAVQSELSGGVTVLVKGSRSMGMERVVQALTGSADVSGMGG